MPDVLSVPPASLEELRREVERLRLLHSITLEFNATLDFDELLPRVFDRVLTAVGADGGSLWIAEGDMLHCRLAVGGARRAGWWAPQMPVGTGFVGDVAQKQRTTMVMEAARDPRFQRGHRHHRGHRRHHRHGDGDGGRRGDGRRHPGGGQAHRHRGLRRPRPGAAGGTRRGRGHPRSGTPSCTAPERRARDLAVLLEISREITATLDIDRVLQSVVNLASRALSFDRGAVGLYEKGKCEIRAVAGQEKVDPDDPALRDLVARAEWAAGRGEPLYLTDREDPASDAERLFVTIFGQDLATDQVRSGLYLPLKDEEGVLGVLLFESATPEFAGETQREVAAILANQTGVALRNAQLYHQVPMVDALGALAATQAGAAARCPGAGSRSTPGSALLLLAALTLIRWPLRVSGDEPVLRPNGAAPRCGCWWTARSSGSRCAEGGRVQRGDLLAVLRATPLAAEREATAADAATADRLASLAASRGDAAEERLHRIRGDALRRELALLDEELGADHGPGAGGGHGADAPDGGANRHLARRGRPAAGARPHRHARARVRRGPAGHPPGPPGPGGPAPGGRPASRDLRRPGDLDRAAAAGAGRRGRGIRSGRPSPTPTACSSRTWRPTRGCSPIPRPP